jgi:3-oxoacyl-[acyl-carrier protein] reductase
MTKTRRTALITGSGRNIGRAVALHLASAGFNVVVNGSSNRAACDAVLGEIRAAGGEGLVAMGNVGERETAIGVAQAGIGTFGGIDVLVNNAAVRPSCDFLSISEEEWNRVLNVNFGAAFWLCRACLPGMIERGWGRIVNFTGMNAQQGYPGKSHVSVSKHAAWGLTKALAKEFGPKGITANIISPGTIVGEAAEHHSSAGGLDALRERNPAGRLGNPEDIAATLDLLVSDQGGFINGQLLQINGGVVT